MSATPPAPGSGPPGSVGSEDAQAHLGRRRELVRGKDLMDASRDRSYKMQKARKRRAAPGVKVKKTEITTPKAEKRRVLIEESINLQELSRRMGVKSTDVLMKLIGMGQASVHINSVLDAETAKVVAGEFGYEVIDRAVSEEDMLAAARVESELPDQAQVARPPIVTIMGHVDHGKTSLLDAIRKTNVAGGEAGGITQHLGAYKVQTPKGAIVFLDTPGHEAFTQMRARGAKVTDLVVLVVAADDGPMPQTIEAINHAKAAEVPILVALNKVDKPDADIERVRRQLGDHGLLSEEWGGQTIFCEVSAKTKKGIDHLLEMILLQSEVLELRANPERAAEGAVLEAYLDRGRGPVSSVLVRDGTLRAGDIVIAGTAFGKIRAMTDDRGRPLGEALPATPVEILGLSNVPMAGEPFHVVTDVKKAETIAESRVQKVQKQIVPTSSKVTLEELSEQIQKGEVAELRLVIKADVQGSVEAVGDSLVRLSTEKVKVNVIHSGVGGITESDVMLASASGAIIIGFNVRPAGKAASLAESEKVDVRLYNVIYNAVDEVKRAMQGLLRPTLQERSLGKAEVRQTFRISKVGTVAGCAVTEGKVTRNAKVRLVRDSAHVWEGKLSSLKRFKDDAREVAAGLECGISLDGFNDLKEGDVIEAFEVVEVAAAL